MTTSRSSARRVLGRALRRAVPQLKRAEADRTRLRRELLRRQEGLERAGSRVEHLQRDNRQLRTQIRRRGIVDDRRLRYVFIVTYGRSGSTLLQGILNSIPGFVVRGENRGALYRLFQMHRQIVVEQVKGDRSKRDEPVSPWFGLDEYKGKAAIRKLRAFVLDTLLRPPPGTRVTGFKEVRWFQSDWREYLKFLQRVFPEARFIVNTRDIDAVSQSKWWATTPDAREQLTSLEQQLAAITAMLGDRAFRVHYDDWVADPDQLRPLFEWLGETYDPEVVRSVLAVRHSY